MIEPYIEPRDPTPRERHEARERLRDGLCASLYIRYNGESVWCSVRSEHTLHGYVQGKRWRYMWRDGEFE